MLAALRDAVVGKGSRRQAAGPHETFVSHRRVHQASDSSFGVVFAVLFVAFGLWPLWSREYPRLWALVVAGLFLMVAALAPILLKPLNRAWLSLGKLLHHVTTPLVMGLIYYGAVVPFGVILRALGRDLLRRNKPQPATATYWIRREPSGPERGSMSRQF
jgi:hypothetical protein